MLILLFRSACRLLPTQLHEKSVNIYILDGFLYSHSNDGQYDVSLTSLITHLTATIVHGKNLTGREILKKIYVGMTLKLTT